MEHEHLTMDDRRLLEGCYRCECNGCKLRREAIAKALRIIDRQTKLGALTESQLAEARSIPVEHGCGSGCLRCLAERAGQL